MSRDNDVFSVLVTKGNKAVLGPGLKPEALTDGQIGVFDADTHLSINGSVATRAFYIAVGTYGASGALESLRHSSGEWIQTANIKAYSFRPHTAARPMIVDVSDFKAECDTDYALKIEFRNMKIFRNQGFNQFSHVYNVRTGCCDDCGSNCFTGDANEIVKLLVNKINFDDKGFVIAQAITPVDLTVADNGTSQDYDAGDVITNIDDLDALITFNKTQEDETTKIYAKLRLISKPLQISQNIAGIDLKYYNQRETTMIVSMVDGFTCGGNITTFQEAAYEEGNGYDIQQREYKTLGWQSDSGAYRTSAVTGLPFNNIKYFADASQKYDRIALEYQHEAQGGWLDYKNELATEIAVPETDTTTRNGLLTVLDAIVARVGLSALADDALIASTNPTVVEPTSEIDDVTKDGLA